MSWDIEDIEWRLTLRLDAHAGDKERKHEQLAKEFRQAVADALRPVLFDPKYREILLFDPEYYFPEDE